MNLQNVIKKLDDGLIDKAIKNLLKQQAKFHGMNAVEEYLWIQKRFKDIDVSIDKRKDGEDTERTFQGEFEKFYQVGAARKNLEWKNKFYSYMQEIRSHKDPSFADALRYMKKHGGKFDKSFVSKMIATIDPSRPVIDIWVSDFFGLQLPNTKSKHIETEIIRAYEDLRCAYVALLETGKAKDMIKKFDKVFPQYLNLITPIKKVDFILWQKRD